VRRAYELTGETTASIRERFGLTENELRKMRKAGGWIVRPPCALPGPLGRRKPLAEALEYRLDRLATLGVVMLEKRIADNGIDQANARTLTELCRAREIMMREIRKEKAAKARETKNDDFGPADDIAFIRAELERRIRNLGRDGERRGGAEGAEEHAGRTASEGP
jgi:hypothetical protein